MKIKAVGYARVSTKDQEREGYSIPSQKKLIQEYAEKNGFELVRIFCESETAKVAGRNQFNSMLEFFNLNADVKVLLVEKTDRIYRNLKDYTTLDPETRGLTMHLIKENEILGKDSRSHQKFIHGIKVLMAKNYSDNLSEEVKKGMLEKYNNNIWPTVAPVGYMNNRVTHNIDLDLTRAPLVKKLFELAATGSYTIRKLAKIISEMGLDSKKGKFIGKSGIERIIENTFYYGEMRFSNFKPRIGTHTPIITKELYDAAQLGMGYKNKSKLTKHDFAYTGIITCSRCGCSISAQQKIKKSGKKYIYYSCTNGKGLCDKVSYIREETIEAQLARALEQIKLTPEIIEWTKTALTESAKTEADFRAQQVQALTTKYKKLEGYVSQSYQDKLDGVISVEDWDSRTSEWKQEQIQISLKLSALKETNSSYMQDGIRLLEIANKASELFKMMPNHEKRELLKLVLQNPRLNDVTIEYDFEKPFDLLTNMTILEKWRSERDSNPRPSA